MDQSENAAYDPQNKIKKLSPLELKNNEVPQNKKIMNSPLEKQNYEK